MKARTHNKNYMSIAVSVLTTKHLARNGGVARQESSPQSATQTKRNLYGLV